MMGEKRQNITQAESFVILKEGLMQLAAPDYPATPILTSVQAKQLSTFLSTTFYAHFSLYQAVFSLDQEETKREETLVVETASFPLPTACAKTLEQVQQEEADARAALELDAYRKQRALDEAALTAKLLAEDPEAERIVQAIVRKQQAAMRENFEKHYAEIEASIAAESS
eukprot:TRINITY_DN11447_c0_g1_i2.p2 TRINITY_DN11447_c0_g1~~TRINITY_DN11447_c0_g1_i2.p2  ORF type:complete len:170 (+),score=52.20 TRINITY_DN11447_c0_g1_i2:806-1315(+)